MSPYSVQLATEADNNVSNFQWHRPQMASYRKSFGHCAPVTNPKTGITTIVCSQTALQQGPVSLTTLFNALGGAISGLTGNHLGRRCIMHIGALLAALGASGMLSAAQKFEAYLGCKCIGGVGLGQIMAAAVVYRAESAVASKRGVLSPCIASARAVEMRPRRQSVGVQRPTPIAIYRGKCLSSARSHYHLSLDWTCPCSRGHPVGSCRREAKKLQRNSSHGFTPSLSTIQIYSTKSRMSKDISTWRNFYGSTSAWTDIHRGGNFWRTYISGLIMVGLAMLKDPQDASIEGQGHTQQCLDTVARGGKSNNICFRHCRIGAVITAST